MREIKFRIWNRIGKRMLYDSSLAFKGNKVIEETGTKVMQFTGLKDKNGKEIYEGDILQREDIIFIVGYGMNEDDNSFGFTLESRRIKHIYPFELSVNKMEVIGNIYENPELLKTSGAD